MFKKKKAYATINEILLLNLKITVEMYNIYILYSCTKRYSRCQNGDKKTKNSNVKTRYSV